MCCAWFGLIYDDFKTLRGSLCVAKRFLGDLRKTILVPLLVCFSSCLGGTPRTFMYSSFRSSRTLAKGIGSPIRDFLALISLSELTVAGSLAGLERRDENFCATKATVE